MANTDDSGLTRPGRLPRLGGWPSVALSILGIATAVDAALRADPDTPADAEERPCVQVARDDLHSPVWTLAFSPDGTRLASATMSGDVWLMDDARGLRTRIPRGRTDAVRSLAFSPDGALLAIGGPGCAVRLVDASSGAELEPVETDARDNASHVSISSDGRHLAAGGCDGTVAIWDRAGRRRLGDLAGHDNITALSFAPDGSTLVVCDVSGRVRLWSIPGRSERMTLAAGAPCSRGAMLAFSPDGTMLAIAAKFDARVRLWDPRDGRLLRAIPKAWACVQALAFSPDGALLAIAQANGSVALWGIAQGRELARVGANEWGVQSVAFSADGRSFVAGGNDGFIRRWELAPSLGGR